MDDKQIARRSVRSTDYREDGISRFCGGYVVQEEFSMSTLLHIDSSPLYGRSVSRELTAAFVNQWKASHPDGKVIDRDLNATAMPPVNAEWVGAVYTPAHSRTPQQNQFLPPSAP